MDFYVMAKSYNCYGGHRSLSPIGDFLLLGSPEFGDAISELTITLHFACTGPAKNTLEGLLERHNNHRATLPKVTYRRSKKKVDIDIASDVMDGRDWVRSARLSLPLFERGVVEIVASLTLLRRRIKASDNFDVDRFLAHCATARDRIPADEDDLQILGEQLRAAGKAKRDAMSPWEKLSIDWEDFHPKSRQILDDPFFWDRTNDFSPNGNDTGADLLDAYSRWRKSHRNGKPLEFLEGLVKRWGYPGIEETDIDVMDQATIALAFAEIKLRGECDHDARQIALKSIDRLRIQAQESTGWSHREERLRTLVLIEGILKRC